MIALADKELEVRSLDDGKASEPINIIPIAGPLLYLEVDAEEVRYSTELDGRRWRWRYRETKETVSYGPLDGFWRGPVEDGELVRTKDRDLGVVTSSGELQRWGVFNVEVVAISPDRKRVAYLEGGRFRGTVSVRDLATGAVMTSPELEEPVALAWLSPTTLLYGISTMVEPTLYRVEVGATQLGKPEVFYTQPVGWFSDLQVGGGTLFMVSMSPTPRGRVVEANRRTRELGNVSVPIGWDATDRMVTWNRANQQISSHAGRLESEPANATRAGDTLIASVRELGGRRALAVSLTTGRELWRHKDKRTIAVRCAGDRARPCYAIRYVDENLDRVVTLDPETGALGTTAIFEQRRIEDLAVREDGQALLVTQISQLREIRPDGTLIATHPMRDKQNKVHLNNIRSVAYTTTGFVVAGTVGRNAYQVGRMENGIYEPLDDAFDKILMLVRPSSDNQQLVSIARSYEPQLYRMRLP